MATERIPSINGGFIPPDVLADPAPAEFDPAERSFALYLDGKLIPVGRMPVVQQDGENVVVVFVTTADALRGLSREAILQKVCGGWREGDVAIYQEPGKTPPGGTVMVEHFVLPETPAEPILVKIKVLSPILYSYEKNERIGGIGTRTFVPLSYLKPPPESKR